MNTENNLLEEALLIATNAHKGQKDKAGQAYILHPLRVMMKMKTDDAKITALLHDVIEDSSVTFQDLKTAGFKNNIIDAVKCLTRDKTDESYEERIKTICENPLALEVKLADLEDNMDIRRLKTITKQDQVRLEKYNRAWQQLTRARA